MVVHRGQPSYYDRLLSLDEIDRVLSTLELRYPDVSLKNAARDVTSSEYTRPGGTLDVARVYQLFAEGSTITLAYMHTVIPALTELCRGLEATFCHPFQTNVYLTPPGTQGAKIHYDTHDVLVLQITGSKRWTTYAPPIELPLRQQDYDPAMKDFGEPTLQYELSAGDVAYIPRGHVHEARSTDTVSLHITIGFLAYTWTDFLLEALADVCLTDATFRHALPAGLVRQPLPAGQMQALLASLQQRLSEPARLEAVRGRFLDDFLASSAAPLRGQLAQLAALQEIRSDTIVQLRPHVIAVLEVEADCTALRHSGGRTTFPRHVEPALRYLLDEKRFAVKHLPGNLDDAGKLTLVRRLVREGLLIAALS